MTGSSGLTTVDEAATRSALLINASEGSSDSQAPEPSTSSEAAVNLVSLSKAKSDVYTFSAFLSFSGFLQLVMTFVLTKFLADMGGKELEASDVIMTTETLLMTMLGGAIYSVSTLMGGPVDFIYELELALLKQIWWDELKVKLFESLDVDAGLYSDESDPKYKKGFEKAMKLVISAAMKEHADEEDAPAFALASSSDVESEVDGLTAKLESLFLNIFMRDEYEGLDDHTFKLGVNAAIEKLAQVVSTDGYVGDLKARLARLLAEVVSPAINAVDFKSLSLDFRGYFEGEFKKLQTELFAGGDPEDRINRLMEGGSNKHGDDSAKSKMSVAFYNKFYTLKSDEEKLIFVRESKTYIGKYYQGGLALSTMSSVPIMLVFGFVKYLFLRGESAPIQKISRDFFLGFLPSVPFAGVYLTQIQLFLSTDKNLAMPLVTAVNTGLSLLSSYFLGLRYGALGLGVGCTIGAVATAGLVTAYLEKTPYYKDHGLHRFLEAPGEVPLKKYIEELWILGRAKGVQAAGELAGVSTMTAMTSFLNESYYAKGQSIALQWLLFVIWIPYNIGPVVSRLVAGRIAVGDNESAKRYIDVGLKLASRLSIFFVLAMGGTQLILGNKNPMISFFTDDPEVANAAGEAILINLLNVWFDYQRTVGAGVLSGFKDVNFAMWNSVGIVVGLGSALGALLAFPVGWGANGLYAGRDIGIFIAFLNLFRRYDWFSKNIDEALESMQGAAESASTSLSQKCSSALTSCCSALFHASASTNAAASTSTPSESDRLLGADTANSTGNEVSENSWTVRERATYMVSFGYGGRW